MTGGHSKGLGGGDGSGRIELQRARAQCVHREGAGAGAGSLLRFVGCGLLGGESRTAVDDETHQHQEWRRVQDDECGNGSVLKARRTVRA